MRCSKFTRGSTLLVLTGWCDGRKGSGSRVASFDMESAAMVLGLRWLSTISSTRRMSGSRAGRWACVLLRDSFGWSGVSLFTEMPFLRCSSTQDPRRIFFLFFFFLLCWIDQSASILLWAIASVNRYLSLAFPRKHTESNTSTSGVTHHRCFHTVAASLIHG